MQVRHLILGALFVMGAPLLAFELAVYSLTRDLARPVPVSAPAPKLMVDAVWVAHHEHLQDDVDRQWLGNLLAKPAGSYSCQVVAGDVLRRSHPDDFRTLDRSLRQLALGVWLSRHTEVGELKQLLVERRYFGRGAHGSRAAAETYFGKVPSELTLAQTAMLAALPQAPNVLDPACSPVRARRRRDWVIQRLVDEGVITRPQGESAMAESLETLARMEACRSTGRTE